MTQQESFEIVCAKVQQLEESYNGLLETVELQQKRIDTLIQSNRNLLSRLNRLDKQNRESHQALW